MTFNQEKYDYVLKHLEEQAKKPKPLRIYWDPKWDSMKTLFTNRPKDTSRSP